MVFYNYIEVIVSNNKSSKFFEKSKLLWYNFKEERGRAMKVGITIDRGIENRYAVIHTPKLTVEIVGWVEMLENTGGHHGYCVYLS